MTGRLGSEFSDADDSAGLVLWQVTNRWQAAQRAALKPFGLTHVQFVLLASLTWLDADGPVTQRRLAEHAATDPMMTSQVLRALEARDLVRRSAHPEDGRARALTVTDAGAALAAAANTVVEACDRDFFAVLGPARSDFVRGLQRLRASAEKSMQA
jgi:DNA-binding MarR family transcriptional regulator